MLETKPDHKYEHIEEQESD